MMVFALLLLVAASDLLVNGPGLQQPSANVAFVVPASNRLIR